MSRENVHLVRRMFEEFGWSPSGIEKASEAGVVAPDIELDFSALYLDGPVVRGMEEWRQVFANAVPWGASVTFEPEQPSQASTSAGAAMGSSASLTSRYPTSSR